jgi:hypothetical protein
MSAPNGDRRLVTMTAKERQHLLAKKQLTTGKTQMKKGGAPMPR